MFTIEEHKSAWCAEELVKTGLRVQLRDATQAQSVHTLALRAHMLEHDLPDFDLGSGFTLFHKKKERFGFTAAIVEEIIGKDAVEKIKNHTRSDVDVFSAVSKKKRPRPSVAD